MDMEQISEIQKMSRDRFDSDKEHYDFIMMQMQEHMIEIDDKKNDSDMHYLKEIADLCILAKMLADCEMVEDDVFKERYEKFKAKIKENS